MITLKFKVWIDSSNDNSQHAADESGRHNFKVFLMCDIDWSAYLLIKQQPTAEPS